MNVWYMEMFCIIGHERNAKNNGKKVTVLDRDI